MRVGLAIAGGVLLAGAFAWWRAGHPGYETAAEAEARVAAVEAKAEAERPRLYRWRDAKGVLQVTDTPPKGRKYEEVALREDVNVIPMSGPADAAAPAGDGSGGTTDGDAAAD